MSIITCTKCDRYVDTDFDVEGVWVDENGKPSHSEPDSFICEPCSEKIFSEEEIENYNS